MVADSTGTQPLQISVTTGHTVTIDWGDGNQDEIVGQWGGDLPHEYDEPGWYTIRISGDTHGIAWLNVDSSNILAGYFAPLTGATHLWVMENRLRHLELDTLESLINLKCQGNDIYEIDVSVVPNLELLDVRTNNLDEIDLSALTKLENFEARENNFAEVDLTGLTKLKWIYVYQNPELSFLNVEECPEMLEIYCQWCDLSSLDVGALLKLERLDCYNNKLPHIDVQNLRKLHTLQCWCNNLTSLDVEGLTSLELLNCRTNNIDTLDVRNLTKLKEFYCHDNNMAQSAVDRIIHDLWVNKESLGANQCSIHIGGSNKVPSAQGIAEAEELRVAGCTIVHREP